MNKEEFMHSSEKLFFDIVALLLFGVILISAVTITLNNPSLSMNYNETTVNFNLSFSETNNTQIWYSINSGANVTACTRQSPNSTVIAYHNLSANDLANPFNVNGPVDAHIKFNRLDIPLGNITNVSICFFIYDTNFSEEFPFSFRINDGNLYNITDDEVRMPSGSALWQCVDMKTSDIQNSSKGYNVTWWHSLRQDNDFGFAIYSSSQNARGRSYLDETATNAPVSTDAEIAPGIIFAGANDWLVHINVTQDYTFCNNTFSSSFTGNIGTNTLRVYVNDSTGTVSANTFIINITSTAPGITVVSPNFASSNKLPNLTVSLTKSTNHLFYSLNGTTNLTICESCLGDNFTIGNFTHTSNFDFLLGVRNNTIASGGSLVVNYTASRYFKNASYDDGVNFDNFLVNANSEVLTEFMTGEVPNWGLIYGDITADKVDYSKQKFWIINDETASEISKIQGNGSEAYLYLAIGGTYNSSDLWYNGTISKINELLGLGADGIFFDEVHTGFPSNPTNFSERAAELVRYIKNTGNKTIINGQTKFCNLGNTDWYMYESFIGTWTVSLSAPNYTYEVPSDVQLKIDNITGQGCKNVIGLGYLDNNDTQKMNFMWAAGKIFNISVYPQNTILTRDRNYAFPHLGNAISNYSNDSLTFYTRSFEYGSISINFSSHNYTFNYTNPKYRVEVCYHLYDFNTSAEGDFWEFRVNDGKTIYRILDDSNLPSSWNWYCVDLNRTDFADYYEIVGWFSDRSETGTGIHMANDLMSVHPTGVYSFYDEGATNNAPNKTYDEIKNFDQYNVPGLNYMVRVITHYNDNNSFTSPTIDFGNYRNYSRLVWTTNKSDSDILKFQVASNNDSSSWNYLGPDGTNKSFFVSSGDSLRHHINNRYMRYKAQIGSVNNSLNISLDSVSVEVRLPEGNYLIDVFANDSLGNINKSSISFAYDKTSPVVSIVGLNNTISTDGIFTFYYNVTDMISLDNCTLYLNGVSNFTNTTILKGVNQSVTLRNLVGGVRNYTVSCVDNATNTALSNVFNFRVLYNQFGGSSTNLNTISDLTNVSSFVVEDVANGKIVYRGNVNISRFTNLSSNIVILDNNITINSVSDPELNTSAELSLFNLTFTDPRVLKNGVVCSDCVELNYSGGRLVFNVTSFSSYTTEEGSSGDSSPTPTPTGSSSAPVSSGGSGGGSTYATTCSSEWECEEWGRCIDGYVTRECVRRNLCFDGYEPYELLECLSDELIVVGEDIVTREEVPGLITRPKFPIFNIKSLDVPLLFVVGWFFATLFIGLIGRKSTYVSDGNIYIVSKRKVDS